MKSKEKLKKMYDYIMIDNEQGLMDNEEVEALTEDYNSILKDLERLDRLEKENKELKDKNSLITNDKEVKLSEIIQLLDNAGVNKNFIKKKQEPYNKFDKKLVEHIEVWNGIFFVKVIDIWNGKIESIDLNATEPAFSKIFHWASIQANIINDIEEGHLPSQKK